MPTPVEAVEVVPVIDNEVIVVAHGKGVYVLIPCAVGVRITALDLISQKFPGNSALLAGRALDDPDGEVRAPVRIKFTPVCLSCNR